MALTACSDDDSAQSDDSASSSAPAAASATSVTTPSSTGSAAVQNSNAPAVPGPSLPPATSIPESKLLPGLDGARCDTVNGPDGALHVIVLEGSSIDCSVAMPIAAEYAPMIATGKPQQVQGWDCGPAQTRGVLSSCTKGADTIAFSIE